MHDVCSVIALQIKGSQVQIPIGAFGFSVHFFLNESVSIATPSLKSQYENLSGMNGKKKCIVSLGNGRGGCKLSK